MICPLCSYDDEKPIGDKWGVPIRAGLLMINPSQVPNAWDGVSSVNENGVRLQQHFAHEAGAIKVLGLNERGIMYQPCGIEQRTANEN